MLRQITFTFVAASIFALAACDRDPSEPSRALGDGRAQFTLSTGVCDGPATAIGAPGPGWPYMYGTSADDKLVTNDAYAVLMYGRAGNDCLIGSAAPNHLFGELGDDVLYGGAGDDYISGGDGSDLIFGEDGDDTITVDDGFSDVVFAGPGKDVIYAADGVRDEIDCGKGADIAHVDPIDVTVNCEIIQPRRRAR